MPLQFPDPLLLLFTLIITGFMGFQTWNLINSFKIGKIYYLGKRRNWNPDKSGKFQIIPIVNKEESPTEFVLAQIYAALFLGITIIVWLLCVVVMIL